MCHSTINHIMSDVDTSTSDSTLQNVNIDAQFLTHIYGNDLLDHCPMVPITNGLTDYLDVVQEKSFVDTKGNKTSLIKGSDGYRREYVAMKVMVESRHSDTEEYKLYEKSVYTVFRRYTIGDLWVMCVSHSTPGRHVFHQLIGACTAIGIRSQQNLTQFIQCIKQGKWWETTLDINDNSVQFRCKLYT